MTFDPYSISNVPQLKVYQVLPLFGEMLNLYCPSQTDDHGYDPEAYFPATFFPFRNVGNGNTWTFDFEENALAGNLHQLILEMNNNNSQLVDGYLLAPFNGIEFNKRLRTVVFPLNYVNVIECKYRKVTGYSASQWFGKIQTIPISSISNVDPKTIPNYLKQNQVNENSLGQTQKSIGTVGHDSFVPLVSKDDLWIPFTQLLVDQPNVVKSLDIFSDGSLSV